MSPPEIGPTARALVPERVEARQGGASALDKSCVRASIEPRTRVVAAEPLSPDRYKLQVTISHETHDKLRRAQDLFRHTATWRYRRDPRPRADAAGGRPRAPPLRRTAGTAKAAPRRPVPLDTFPRRSDGKVWRRDQGRCAFVGRAAAAGKQGSSSSPRRALRRRGAGDGRQYPVAVPGAQPLRGGIAVFRGWNRRGREARASHGEAAEGERIACSVIAGDGAEGAFSSPALAAPERIACRVISSIDQETLICAGATSRRTRRGLAGC